MLSGTSSEEIQVKATAAEFWDVYGTQKLTLLLLEKLPHFFQKIELLEGDGGVGTVVKVTFVPGNPILPGVTYQVEKYTVLDHEKRVKVVEFVEGEILSVGFKQLCVRSEVLEKDENSSIVKITVEYEIPEEAADKLALLSANPFAPIIHVVADSLNKAKEEV